jgi:hypothetical protein
MPRCIPVRIFDMLLLHGHGALMLEGPPTLTVIGHKDVLAEGPSVLSCHGEGSIAHLMPRCIFFTCRCMVL